MEEREVLCVSLSPIHGNKPLKTGLVRHLLKKAEISETDV